jgi:hypothetical protein
MLDTNPTALLREIEYALEFRRQITRESRGRIRRYAGDDYRADWVNDAQVMANLAFSTVMNTVPALAHSTPSARLSALSGVRDDVSRALEIGLNANLKVTRPAAQLRKMAHDWLFAFAVGIVTLEDAPVSSDGETEERRLVSRIRRMSPLRYFCDPVVQDERPPRYQGHVSFRDKNDMLAATDPNGKPVWDRKAVRMAMEDANLPDMLRELMGDGIDKMRPQRGQIAYFELFHAETGMIHTIAADGSSDRLSGLELRPPRRAFGPETGRYVLMPGFYVPDQRYPLALLAVSDRQMQEINTHKRQAAMDAETAKRMVIVDAMQDALGKQIQAAESGSVIQVPGFDARMAQTVEFGGAMQQTLLYIENLKAELRETTGQTQTVRGQLTGVTKGEVDAAQSAFEERMGYSGDLFREGVEQLLHVMLWDLENVPDIRYEVPANTIQDQLPDAQGMVTFEGGPAPGEEPVNTELIQVSIEPFSMERIPQTVLVFRAQQAARVVTEGLALASQNPAFKLREYIDDQFQLLNVDEAADRYVDFQMLQVLRQVALGAVASTGV